MSKVIGIDLGTTNSCVAVMDGNETKVIENSEGARTTPSIVAFHRRRRNAGRPARQAPGRHQPGQHLLAVKRLIGRRFDDAEVEKDKKLCPTRSSRRDNGDAWVEARGKKYSPSQISAFILQDEGNGGSLPGRKVTQAVITVPAYFQRRPASGHQGRRQDRRP
jgi:molecular chaperone DnaK